MTLKITDKHFATLKEKIEAVLAKYPDVVNAYEEGQFTNASKVKDLQRRFCWDLLWATTPSTWIRKELYPYLNDTHIYSALKKICPTVTRRF